jgi:glycerophosphoryl diester phosphodiesterase
VRRIGHKGADAIAPGNTLESFRAAVEIGVDMIEFDVLARRTGALIAHDGEDARMRSPLGLADALRAFTQPPLDAVSIDCDLKFPGAEAEVADLVRDLGIVERTMVSSQYAESLDEVHRRLPQMRRGWTYPKVTRDWTRRRWATPAVAAALVGMRRRLPRLAERILPRLGVEEMWVYHPLISPRLARVLREADVSLIAWTVDDLPRMRALAALGADGICTNDPRLFDQL